jgi:hypothetical protein
VPELTEREPGVDLGNSAAAGIPLMVGLAQL